MNRSPSDPSLTLPPLLEEFRSALQDEIEVAKRNSTSSAIPLNNGHKVGEQGSAHQYAFQIDSVLNTPDGAPGDLMILGKSPMAATIVSVEGLHIVISVESDLGKFVPTARLQTNLTILMRKLIERIEVNAYAPNPAANRMLGSAPVLGSPIAPRDKPELNDNQLTALKSSLGRDLTVIWGPPGTGKTHTIGTITEYLHKNSRSVLLVSHTNTAVDQAIRHVAESMKEQIQGGAVIRVGEVRDEVLRSDYPDVLLKTQVERQSRELVLEREKLENQIETYLKEISAAKKSISIIEWLKSANGEIVAVEESIDEISKLRKLEQDAKDELAELQEQHSNLLELQQRTAKVIDLRKQLLSKRDEQKNMQLEIEAVSIELENLINKIAEQESRIEIAKRIDPLRQQRSIYPAPEEQNKEILHLSDKVAEAKETLANTQSEFAQAEVILKEAQKAGALERVFKRLPKPDDQKSFVDSLSEQITAANAEVMAIQKDYDAATTRLSRTIELDSVLSIHEVIGTQRQELDTKERTERKREQVSLKLEKLDESLSILPSHILQIENEEGQLSKTFVGDVDDIYSEVCANLQKYEEMQESIESYGISCTQLEHEVKALLSRLLRTIQEWVSIEETAESLNETFEVVRQVYSELSDQHASKDTESLSRKVSSCSETIPRLNTKIGEIDAKLAKVEHEVINKAAVIGATLTKVYLSDDIQGRRFDTVILDEASMAPIPALWAAALLSDNNLIIVGDFKQLPPIVLSNNELTKKWLGRDIFEVSGLKERWEKDDSPDYFIPLVEQRRMLPEISEVANLFYDGILQNASTIPDGFQKFSEWYVNNWHYDNPVLLVETGPLNAWVTSVVKGGSSSRLNFLSAAVSVDLAEQLLSPDRPKRIEGSPKRILLVSPYRAHAKLISLLLQDFEHLEDEVVAGTVHSFQGSEADVVIFDLVVDEPHFRVNLFMPSLDEQLKCLLNVALTRARFRLIVLGDFDYCEKLGKKAYLGKTLIPFLLERFPRIDARDIIPDGLAARAAKAQMTTLGGEIDPDSDRIVVTQVDFYRLLSNDLAKAQKRVIIYSPFITPDRVAFILPQLQAAVERDVEVYVITKDISERLKSDLLRVRATEKQLSDIGVVVIHKLRMHEKLVFIDEDLTWSGSLNPLSFSNTQEIMERRRSKKVYADYFQILRLQELLGIQGTPESQCPICGAEMIAAEGKDQPFYWRCIHDKCYTRSIDKPYPFDGVLSCPTCNSTFEFGYWGDYPHWRCTANKKHRQKIFKSHLRLPKMASIVPESEREKLCTLLQIDNGDDYFLSSKTRSSKTSEQSKLFDWKSSKVSRDGNSILPEKDYVKLSNIRISLEKALGQPVSRQLACKYTQRRDFPTPAIEEPIRLWNQKDIEVWCEKLNSQA